MTTSALNIVVNGRDQASAVLARIDRSVGGISRSVGRLQNILVGGLAVFFSTRALARSAEDIDKLAKASDRLDLPVERMQALRLQAELTGAAMPAVEAAMQKMFRIIAESSNGNQTAIDSLARIGLTVDDLAGMDADQAFGVIADALNQIEDTALRAGAAQRIFGEGFAQIDNLVRGGSEGIRLTNEEIERMGIGLSRVDAAKVEQANDAMGRMKTVASGITDQVVVALAPVVTGIASSIQGMLEQAGGARNIIDNILDGAIMVADFLDRWIWQPMRNGLEFMMAIQMRIYSTALTIIDGIGQGIVYILNLIPGVEVGMTSMFRDLAAVAGEASNELFDGLFERLDNPPPPNRIRAWVDQLRAESEAAADSARDAALPAGFDDDETATSTQTSAMDKLIDGLLRQTETFGMASREAQLYQAALEGATDAQLDQAYALIEQLDAMERQQELAKEGQAVFERTRSAAEKRAQEIERLEQLLAAGAITEDTFMRAMDQFQESISQGSVQRLAAVENRFLGRGSGSELQSRTERNTLKAAQEMTLVRGIVNAVKTSVAEIANASRNQMQVRLEGIV